MFKPNQSKKKLQQFTKLCKGNMSQNSKTGKMVLRAHADRTIDRKSDMPGRVFLPRALAFTAIYVVSARTGVLHCFDLRLLSLYFYFKYLEWLVL